MRIVQIQQNGKIVAGKIDGDMISLIGGQHTTYDLAMRAVDRGVSLSAVVAELGVGDRVNYQQCLDDNWVVAPLHHPQDDAHFLITGTGLTHLGSASARNSMHGGDTDTETDTMRIFRWGIEGGKPAEGTIGVQPEWFYKGDGSVVVNPNAGLILPNFADDGGEEPEITGLYINDKNGTPHRIGFAMGNEYSDHVMEKKNYLYLAHSKLRACSFGPELVVGDLPSHIEGTNTIYRNGEAIWSKPFVSGEDNMSHTIANLEQHHFKYDVFRRPGDIHAHFFGTATISFADNVVLQNGDVMEISCGYFGAPLRNPLQVDDTEQSVMHVNIL